MFHHQTIRKYTAALLDVFNNIEIQYEDSYGNTIIRSVPIEYRTKEKSHILDKYTDEQLKSGNINVLPRANISLSAIVKQEQRVMNKNNKINVKKKENTLDFMYNSVPYEFTYELTVLCRGMNEATQIIEQVAPKFNPILNVDIWDATNLNEPTRIPVKLLDIGIETEEYEEYSSNIITVSFGLSLTGNLYPPIQTASRVKKFNMNINEQIGNKYNKRIIKNWDVDPSGRLIIPGKSIQVQNTSKYPPIIVDIVPQNPLIVGQNNLVAIWNDPDNRINEMTFEWQLLTGQGSLTGNLDTAVLNTMSHGIYEIQLTITDLYGNYTTMIKQLTV